jgi:hypothetical protein
MSFSWVPIYEELATALVAYENRQGELIQLLAELNDAKIPALPIGDKTASGDATLTEIDPFTFFASFNRGQTDENRRAVLTRLKAHFGLAADVPTDFHGIPVADKRSSWFFQYAADRQPDEIPSLWALARQAVSGGRKAIVGATFDRCIRIKTVKTGKMSMGLFWLRPREFMPLDRRSMALLRAKAVDVPETVDSWAAYAKVLDGAVSSLGNDFSRLSLDAYERDVPPASPLLAAEPAARPPRWWLFQCNPDKYDLDRALQEMTRTSWRMTRYADDIAVGDRLFLWVSGPAGGLRAVATVDSPVAEVEKDDDPFLRDGDALGSRMKRVGIRFDDISGLVRRDAVLAAPGLQNLGVLKWPQGTNYPVTDDEAKVLLALYAGSPEAPGTPRSRERPPLPLNLILHGPPGTGKTYRMRAMRELFAPATARPTTTAQPDVADLTWFEVIAIALHDLGRPAEAREVIAHPLVQAKYVERAPTTKLGPYVHATLRGHTVRASKTVHDERRTKPLVFDMTEDSKWFLPAGLPEELRFDPAPSGEPGAPDNQFFVTFHPSFTYEDFVEGIRPESDEEGGPVRYPLRAGIFRQACERAVQLAGFDRGLAEFCTLPSDERKRLLADAQPAVLFIDEINRGNVARILGELITLIERDKRLGGDQELIVTLPGSRQRFGVPSNLWIIGTMNTADRSVVALDVALRRRFAFQECPPQPELLDDASVDGVNLGKLLRAINRRLLVLRDRDHLIGHASFLPLKDSPTLKNLQRVFGESVLPLLLEYFHDDLGRVGLVLGPQWVRRAPGSDVFAKGFEHDQRDDLAERPVWEVAKPEELPIEAFRAIHG